MPYEIGILAHIKGYQYSEMPSSCLSGHRDAVLCHEDPLSDHREDPQDDTELRVERAIRHAIEVAWGRGEVLIPEQPLRIHGERRQGKPTNSEFIGTDCRQN